MSAIYQFWNKSRNHPPPSHIIWRKHFSVSHWSTAVTAAIPPPPKTRPPLHNSNSWRSIFYGWRNAYVTAIRITSCWHTYLICHRRTEHSSSFCVTIVNNIYYTHNLYHLSLSLYQGGLKSYLVYMLSMVCCQRFFNCDAATTRFAVYDITRKPRGQSSADYYLTCESSSSSSDTILCLKVRVNIIIFNLAIVRHRSISLKGRYTDICGPRLTSV